MGLGTIGAGIKIAVEIFNQLPDERKEEILADLETKLNNTANKLLLTEAKERIAKMTDEDLKLFIPHIYQRRITDVDYDSLWDSGARLLSYDIDDTILPFWKDPGQDKHIPKTKALFDHLKQKGFTVIILSNANEARTRKVCEFVRADGYISRAKKPDTKNFRTAFEQYGKGIEKSQMVHFGNRMCKDVFGGNSFGCKTCLVKDMAVAAWVTKVKKMLFSSVGHEIRIVMKERGLWHKHHVVTNEDQYYQFGEKQKYSDNFPW